MTRYADYRPDGAPIGRVIVLPGRIYTPDGPLLFFAAQTALARGWEVRQVWWDPPAFDDDTAEVAWVGEQLAAALEGYAGRVLVVAKSLGTLAAEHAATFGYQAAWLTPLLTEPDVAGVLTSYPAEQLIVIGDRDPYLDEDVLSALPGEHLVVPGDHILRVADDPVAMASSHETFVRAFDGWLTALP